MPISSNLRAYDKNMLQVSTIHRKYRVWIRRGLLLMLYFVLVTIAAVIIDSLIGNDENKWSGPFDALIPSAYNSSKNVKTNKEELELMIDKRKRTDEELIGEIESQLPSLPLEHSLKVSSEKEKKQKKFFNDTCVVEFPSVFDLEFDNIYWQTLRTSNGTFQLLSAYYDVRNRSNIGPAIRIIGMIDRANPSVKTYCQMWFDRDVEPKIVESLHTQYEFNVAYFSFGRGSYQPYGIACPIPKIPHGRGPPVSVSLVERACDRATNNLRVIYNKPEVKRDFAVCVKGLNFLDDISVRLIEWIELIGLLGAHKIFFYQFYVHPNVTKVLDHYTKLGKINVTPITLPGGQPNNPGLRHMYLKNGGSNKRFNEIIPYTDCLYKHMYEYKYIAVLDVDEVIMPLKDSTWPELMKRIVPKALAYHNNTRASHYAVRNVWFLDGFGPSNDTSQQIPKYMHMLQHTNRMERFSDPGSYVKSFTDTEMVDNQHNHCPLTCWNSTCKEYPVETEDAQLQHYHFECADDSTSFCSKYDKIKVVDATIWRYKDRLIQRVTDALKILGFLSSNKPST